MTSPNVSVVLDALRSFGADDLDALAALHHADVYGTAPAGWPESGPFVGRDAVMGQAERLTAEWEEHEILDLEVVAAEGEWVVVGFNWRVKSARGIEGSIGNATAYLVRDGRIAECHFRWERADALEAAGLQ